MKQFKIILKVIALTIVALGLGMSLGCSAEFDFPTECEQKNMQIDRDIRVLKSTEHWSQELEDRLNAMRCTD